MNTRHALAMFAFASLAIPQIGHAQTTARMLCQGTLETRRDETMEEKPVTVDVLLDIANQTIALDGFWGCLADLGNLSSDPRTYQCVGRQPVKLSENELAYFAKIDGPLYTAQTTLRLNRYTATMTVYSHGTSKPGSKATWKSVSISGKLLCKDQNRKF